MSVRNKAEVKKKRRVEKKKTQKPKSKPAAPAAKRLLKVTKAELDFVASHLTSQMELFEKRVAQDIRQLWGNQAQLKGGLDLAERHLRAYRRVFIDVVGQLNGNGEVTAIEVPGPDGTSTKVINMRYYMALADAEIHQLAQQEELARKAREEAEAKAKEKPEEVPAKDDGIPEGAAVFGGNDEPSNSGNEGQETTAEQGSGGEDGAPRLDTEGEVPDVQTGNGSDEPAEQQRADM